MSYPENTTTTDPSMGCLSTIDSHLDAEPFSSPVFGPRGWCDEMQRLLSTKLIPNSSGSTNLLRFNSLTVKQLAPVAEQVEAADRSGVKSLDYLFLDMWNLGKVHPRARFFGTLVTSNRGDERVEIDRICLRGPKEGIQLLTSEARKIGFGRFVDSKGARVWRIWD